jgi:signal transduction histidine kinase
MESRGSVTVTVAPDDAQHLLITIEDTGKGIPPQILPKLMQEGESFNKPDGSGLGLYGARVAVDSWKGTIHSKLGFNPALLGPLSA